MGVQSWPTFYQKKKYKQKKNKKQNNKKQHVSLLEQTKKNPSEIHPVQVCENV